MTRPSAGAILVAAGRGERMHGVDKTLAPLHGRPVAAWSLDAFAACDAIDVIVLVSGARNHDALIRLAGEYGRGKVAQVTPGGDRRQDSVAAGLARLLAAATVDLIAVHDVARPLVTPTLIEAGLTAAARHGAASAAAPVTDTIKEVDAHGRVQRTVPREILRAVQTPQVFQRDLLVRAHAAAADDVTDDIALVEALGHSAVVYDVGAPNLKITVPDDLALAAALLAERLATVSPTAPPAP